MNADKAKQCAEAALLQWLSRHFVDPGTSLSELLQPVSHHHLSSGDAPLAKWLEKWRVFLCVNVVPFQGCQTQRSGYHSQLLRSGQSTYQASVDVVLTDKTLSEETLTCKHNAANRHESHSGFKGGLSSHFKKLFLFLLLVKVVFVFLY